MRPALVQFLVLGAMMLHSAEGKMRSYSRDKQSDRGDSNKVEKHEQDKYMDGLLQQYGSKGVTVTKRTTNAAGAKLRGTVTAGERKTAKTHNIADARKAKMDAKSHNMVDASKHSWSDGGTASAPAAKGAKGCRTSACKGAKPTKSASRPH